MSSILEALRRMSDEIPGLIDRVEDAQEEFDRLRAENDALILRIRVLEKALEEKP